jgi:hypothetical protein
MWPRLIHRDWRGRGYSVYCRPMRSRVPVWLIVLCLVWQGIAFAGAGGRPSGLDNADHDRMHRQNLLHHHGVDGTVAPDDSVASLLHALADLASAVSIESLVKVAVLAPAPAPLAIHVEVIPSAACLDGPTRPPKPIA